MTETGTVLLAGDSGDPHLEAVTSRLEDQGVDVRRWHLDTFPDRARVSLAFDDDGAGPAILHLDGGPLDLARVRSVLFRGRALGLFTPIENPGDIDTFVGFELGAAFRGTMDALRDARWVNHPEALFAIEPRAAQAVLAARLGIPVTPATADEWGNVAEPSQDGDRRLTALIADDRMFAAEPMPPETAAALHRFASEAGLHLARFEIVHRRGAGLLVSRCETSPEWLDLPDSAAITAAVAALLVP